LKKVIAAFLILTCLVALTQIMSYGANEYDSVVDPFHEYGYEDMVADAVALQSLYPGLITVGSIGTSAEGRSLLLLTLGNGARKVFVDGAMHASEYICSSYLMYMAEQYANAYVTTGTYDGHGVREILNKITFCIVPMVNPDGVNLVQHGPESALYPEAVLAIAETDENFAGYA
jgi:g-D-glutamyl-meso-diaminopimelate peptidase